MNVLVEFDDAHTGHPKSALRIRASTFSPSTKSSFGQWLINSKLSRMKLAYREWNDGASEHGFPPLIALLCHEGEQAEHGSRHLACQANCSICLYGYSIAWHCVVMITHMVRLLIAVLSPCCRTAVRAVSSAHYCSSLRIANVEVRTIQRPPTNASARYWDTTARSDVTSLTSPQRSSAHSLVNINVSNVSSQSRSEAR